jgi:hypothetical protein
LAQAEEPMAVPGRPGDGPRNARQAAIDLTLPAEALLQHGHLFKLALPFAHKNRSGLEIDTLAALWWTRFEGRITGFSTATDRAQHLLVESPKGSDLDAVGEETRKEPARQMVRRPAAQVVRH